jgi:hypothetical protein
MMKRLHRPAFVTLSVLGENFERRITSKSLSRWIWQTLLAFLLCVGATSFAKADPVSVIYTATQISGSEWQYNYQVAGSYVSGDDLAIYFPLTTSSNLSDLGTGGSDWTTFVFQPDPSLPADGEFDMLANLDNPSLTPVFAVQFQYLGLEAPGSQFFTLYDPSFNIVDTGATQSTLSPVPEPAPFLLMGSGLVWVWRRVRHQR